MIGLEILLGVVVVELGVIGFYLHRLRPTKIQHIGTSPLSGPPSSAIAKVEILKGGLTHHWCAPGSADHLEAEADPNLEIRIHN